MSDVKALGSTQEVHWKLRSLNLGGGWGISHVGVKSVDIRRNINSEGSLLGLF